MKNHAFAIANGLVPVATCFLAMALCAGTLEARIFGYPVFVRLVPAMLIVAMVFAGCAAAGTALGIARGWLIAIAVLGNLVALYIWLLKIAPEFAGA